MGKAMSYMPKVDGSNPRGSKDTFHWSKVTDNEALAYTLNIMAIKFIKNLYV